jgi:hypothetical protein
MSIAHITLNNVTRRAQAGVTAADSVLAAARAETKTLSSSSQATTMTGAVGDVWVVAVNADTMVSFGSSPTAVAAGGSLQHFLPSGTTREFNVSAAAEKCAVILQA